MSEARIVIERSGPERPWLGQLVRFDVQVWRPKLDAAPLPPFEFDELETPGVIAHFREEASPPDEKQEGDQTFLVQHRTLVVFPQKDGHLKLPPLVARWTDEEAAQSVQSAALEFDAAIPPHADERLVVSPSLHIEQSTNQPLRGLKVGDGFVRTVTVSATDSDPWVLPTIDFSAVSGLSLYAQAPKDASSAERGQLSASRTFQATYVVERVGHYELEAATLRWLDPASGKFHEATAPELSFWAGPNVGLGLSMWGTTTGAGLLGFGLSSLVLALALWAIWRRSKGPFAFERALARANAERNAFAELRRAARHGAPLQILIAAYAWLRVRFPLRTERSLAPLRDVTPALTEQLGVIERSAFGPQQGRSSSSATAIGVGLAALLVEARSRLAKRKRPMILESTRMLNAPRE